MLTSCPAVSDTSVIHNTIDGGEKSTITTDVKNLAASVTAGGNVNMPAGPYKADHPLTTPPPKERTLQHIETLITHFLQVSWGPVMPANESFQMIEATKGINSYYLTSAGGGCPGGADLA